MPGCAFIKVYFHGNVELSSSVALFRPVRLLSPPILISCMELNYHIPDVGKSLQECRETIAVDHNLYGLNSVRSGGATFAVSCNPNLSEKVLRQGDDGSPILRKICIFSKMFLNFYK